MTTAGNHEVSILIERIFGAGPFATPVEYVAGVSFDLASPEPVPETKGGAPASRCHAHKRHQQFL
jgi:hypothetical protein